MLWYLNVYHFVSSCKKSENFNQSMVRKSQKPLFLGQFGPVLAQNGPKKFFPKKWIVSHFNIYYSSNSCKKSENSYDSISRKSQKTLFLGHFGPILAQNGPKKFFSKNWAPSLFDVYSFAPSCKKSKNFNDPILRKAHNGQTYGRTDVRTQVNL